MRSVPPANILARSPCAARMRTASSRVAGAAYVMARTTRSACSRGQIAKRLAVVTEPVEQDVDVCPESEVFHAEVKVVLRLVDRLDLRARANAVLDARFDDVFLDHLHLSGPSLPGLVDVHAVVAGSPLDHVHA